ncbi:hypothetical protein ABTZ03_01945 [Kitasatospora sp. NPDC096077]|uniref:hypothetical protein n=1 Tax=Kitasatospora sp. NPDC096077 TaxID=3155544 RepID=UPI0033200D09
MSDDPVAGDCTVCGKVPGGNCQQGTQGLSVQGQTGDVHYYAAACGHHSVAGVRRRTAGFSPVPYEMLREELHRITRACSRLVDDLRATPDSSEGSPWD